VVEFLTVFCQERGGWTGFLGGEDDVQLGGGAEAEKILKRNK